MLMLSLGMHVFLHKTKKAVLFIVLVPKIKEKKSRVRPENTSKRSTKRELIGD